MGTLMRCVEVFQMVDGNKSGITIALPVSTELTKRLP